MDLVRPGHFFFAEAAMFMGGRYPIDARALESKHFVGLVQDNGNLSLRLPPKTSQRMRRLINE